MGNNNPYNTQYVLYIKVGAASMAGAWFIHWTVRSVWPVRDLYGPLHLATMSDDVLCYAKRSTAICLVLLKHNAMHIHTV